MSGIDDRYDVVWTSPSTSSAGSMPCGGGGIGVNVWAEDGDVLFYLDRSGSFDEHNQQLKLGRVRITLDPSPFTPGGRFEQRLHLRDGHLTVHGATATVDARITLWVDVHHPVVHVDVDATSPLSVTAAYESWRTADRPLDTTDRMACFSFAATTPSEIALRTHADRVRFHGDQVIWCHVNDNTDLLFDKLVTTQHLDAVRDRLWNPQRDFVFGGILDGAGFLAAGVGPRRHAGVDCIAWRLRSHRPRRAHRLTVTTHADHSGDEAAWEDNLLGVHHATADTGHARTVDWWHTFWDRSHIVIDPHREGAHPDGKSDRPWQVGRSYQLFRHLMGCNAHGDHPSKFNGSLFTMDPDGTDAGRTPDFRRWGGGSATAQNQRLLYFPLLASGDSDLIEVQLDFYRRALPAAELRTQVYWGHRGASFAEQLENFGLPCGDAYERHWGHRGVAPRPGSDHGELRNDYCCDLYDTVLEFCLLALDVERYTGRDITRYLPLIDSCVTFFDEHYRLVNSSRTGTELNGAGKLVLFPGSACETYKDTADSVTTTTALRVVLTRLGDLPPPHATPEQRQRWTRILDTIPTTPLRTINGHRTLAPARSWSRIQNEELPQLYPVWPWRVYGIGRPDLQLAVDTFRYGADRPDQHGTAGWKQDPIFAACLGLTTEAAAMIEQKLSGCPRRYPVYWGPNFDWTPDLNHLGSGAVALQEMLLTVDGRNLHLLPAWPATWDADFKLHAPYETLIEGSVAGGRLTHLSITPHHRWDDVIVHHPHP